MQQGYCILCGSVRFVGKLVLVKGSWCDASYVFHDQPFQTFSRYGGESHWPIVVQACERARERLKMSVKTSVSWSPQFLSTRPATPSGPAAFLGLMVFKQSLTSWGLRVGAAASEGRGRGS